MKPIIKRLLSSVLSTTISLSAIPIVPVHAEEITESYPYIMFASSYNEGAITINAENFSINGRIATNGTVKTKSNNDSSGYVDNNICEEMIYIPNRVDSDFFASTSLEKINDDYQRNDTNINIDCPLSVNGNIELNGNITIQSGIYQNLLAKVMNN